VRHSAMRLNAWSGFSTVGVENSITELIDPSINYRNYNVDLCRRAVFEASCANSATRRNTLFLKIKRHGIPLTRPGLDEAPDRDG
jgi:hypothetical protein